MPEAESSEQILVARAASGDRHAFRILVHKYQDQVFGLCMRIAESREMAEELAQDAFVRAFKSLGGFRGECRFSTWLFTVTRSVCFSSGRKRPHPISFPGDDILQAWDTKDPGMQPADMIRQRELTGMLAIAMAELAPEDRMILNLFYQGGQSLGEIARITENTETNIKVKLHRIRGKLRGILLRQNPALVRELREK